MQSITTAISASVPRTLRPLLLGAACAAPVVLAQSPPEDEAQGQTHRVVLAPEDGRVLFKRWTIEQALRSSAVYVERGGVRHAADASLDIKTTTTLDIVDHYGETAGGRPLELRRFYDRLRRGVTMTVDELMKFEQEGELDETGVVFTWQPDEGEYGRYYDGQELREELLPQLDPDMDLRCLLPAGEVAIGAQWTIPSASLAGALAAGGALRFKHVEGPGALIQRSMDSGIAGSNFLAFGGESTGEARATLSAVTTEDGVTRARISVDLGGRWVSDVTEHVTELRLEREIEAGTTYPASSLTFSVKGKGELVWDLTSGHAESWSFFGTQETSFRLSIDSAQSGAAADVATQTMIMSGTYGVTFSARPTAPIPLPAAGVNTKRQIRLLREQRDAEAAGTGADEERKN